MKVLIADDDITSRKMLAIVLEGIGHDVLETVDGLQALDALQKPDAPKLAVIDWMMPKMDGLEVIRGIRALVSLPQPYVIILSTRGEKADIVTGLEVGADDYLIKPFDIGELQARVSVGVRMIDLEASRHDLAESLRVTAAQLEETFNATNDMIAVMDRDCKILRSNRAMNKVLGTTDVVGKHCYHLIHGTDCPPKNCASREVINTGKTATAEIQEMHLDGRWYDVSVSPIFDDNGEVIQVVHVMRDVTHKKK
ncbi:MAG: response regulator [Deltaproteobacteria bacterium]|nr:response regulator [Deltaproteobacteria bacterium]